MSRWKEWVKIVDKLESLHELVVEEINFLSDLEGIDWVEEEVQQLLKVENGIQVSLRSAFQGLQKNVNIELMVTDGRNDRTDKE